MFETPVFRSELRTQNDKTSQSRFTILLLYLIPENDVIREYGPTDLEDLLKAWESANAVAHPFLSAEFQARERENIINLYLPNTETWVWVADDRVVGFVALLGNEVGGLFIDAAYQRRGIGAALVDHARSLREELEVDVFKKNTIGRSFYAKYGFVPMHEAVHEASGFETIRLKLASG